MQISGRLAVLALVVGLAGASAALAGDKEVSKGTPDLNGDGTIDASETTVWDSKTFSRFDENGDGLISRAEYVQRAAGRVSGQPKRIANMAESGPELQARSDQVFDDTDADGDSKLSRSEYMTYAATLFESSRGSRATIDANRFASAMGALSFDPTDADADSDGSISAAEAAADVELDFSVRDGNGDDELAKNEWTSPVGEIEPSRWIGRFDMLDADKDGFVSPIEVSAWRAALALPALEPAAGPEQETSSETSEAEPDQQHRGLSVWAFRRWPL